MTTIPHIPRRRALIISGVLLAVLIALLVLPIRILV